MAVEDQLNEIHERTTTFQRRLAYVSAVVLVLLSLLTGWALYGRFDSGNQYKTSQQSLNKRFAAVSLQDCLEIEKLKTNVRDQAIANERDLAKNAKLLGIKLTPALIAQEKIDTNKVLKTYAAEVCPRPAPKPVVPKKTKQ